MWVAAVQSQPGEDAGQNLADALTHCEAALDAGAELVVLPEYFSWYGAPDTWRASAEELSPRLVERFGKLAELRKAHILLGTVLEPADGGKVRNTSVLLGPEGELARYSKIHLFDVDTPEKRFRESATLEAGEEIVVAEVAGLKLGFAICYDLRFPRLFAALRERGAELICLPAAFTLHTGKDHWEPLLRARAIETQCYLLAAALSGDCQGKQCYGHSMLVDPWGLVTARASDGPGFVLGRIEPGRLARVRRDIPLADHHRSLD